MEDIREGLISNFSYRHDSLKHYVKLYDETTSEYSFTRHAYSDERWSNLILNELKQGRPIIYSLGLLSHAANVDGFDGVNAFHLNYGWGGESNGYYTLDKMRKGEDYWDSKWQSFIDEEYYISMVTGCIPVEQSSSEIESVAQ